MNTPEHDDWERLFRQRLADFEAQPPADALARILAAAHPSPAPVATRPTSTARTLGIGGMVVVLLGIWLMQATQRPQQHALAEVAQPIQHKANGETIASTTSNRRSDYTSLAEGKREQNEAMKPLTATTKADKALETVGIPAELNKSSKPENQFAHSDGLRAITRPITPSGESKITTKPVTSSRFAVNSNRVARSSSFPRRDFLAKLGRTVPQQSLSGPTPKVTLSDVSSAAPNSRALAVNSETDQSFAAGSGQRLTSIPAINSEATKSIAPDFSQGLTIAWLETQRPVQPYHKRVRMAETVPEALPSAPAVVRQQPARAWFVAVTPLYTYQQLTPVHTDDRYVEQIQTPGALSGGRAGWRAQVGIEQAINKQFMVRAGVTVSELRQSVQYSSRGASFDSARVEVLDNQTIRLTPLYRRQTGQLPANRQFVGISTDIIWRPSVASGLSQTWQPYLTAGLSAGKYTGAGGVMSGFWQASAGVERAIWPGWWLRVEPSVQYGWHTLTDSPVLTTRPYTYGLTIGLLH